MSAFSYSRQRFHQQARQTDNFLLALESQNFGSAMGLSLFVTFCIPPYFLEISSSFTYVGVSFFVILGFSLLSQPPHPLTHPPHTHPYYKISTMHNLHTQGEFGASVQYRPTFIKCMIKNIKDFYDDLKPVFFVFFFMGVYHKMFVFV